MIEDLGKRDIHHSDRKVEWQLKKVRRSHISSRQKKQIEDFVKDLRIGRAGKKVKNHRICSYLQFILMLHHYFKKDLDKITEKEAVKFYTDLQEDKIKKKDGMPYSASTKDLYIRTLKRFLAWCFKGRDNKKYQKLVLWMKEEQPKSNKKVITFEQAQEIIKAEKNIRNKCLFMFLFDSGARIEECLNLRLKDCEIHKKKDGSGEYYLIDIRYSKTEPRRISVPLTTELLTKWLKKHPNKKEKNAFLFPLSYDNSRKIIRVMSKRVLGYTLVPHELRHSSASYYILKVGAKNIGSFYYRYGWKFNSKVANTYIKRNILGGEIGQEEVIRVVETGKIEELENENRKLKNTFKEMQMKNERISRTLGEMQTEIKKIKEDIISRIKEKGDYYGDKIIISKISE